jgi:hypothetical protein
MIGGRMGFVPGGGVRGVRWGRCRDRNFTGGLGFGIFCGWGGCAGLLSRAGVAIFFFRMGLGSLDQGGCASARDAGGFWDLVYAGSQVFHVNRK